MPRDMRILHILYRVVRGGAEHGTVDTVLGLRQAGQDAGLVVIGAQGQSKLEDKLAAGEVPVYYLGKGRGFSARVYRQLRDLFRELKPDVFHMHMNLWRYALPPALQCRVPAIVHTFHTTAREEANGLERWLRRVYLGRRVQAVALVNAIAASVENLYGYRSCTQIFHGTDVARFERDEAERRRMRKGLGFSVDDVVVLFVARMAPMKNHRLLIDCFAGLARGNERLRLGLVGSGPEEEAVRAQVAALGIGDRVHFAGQQEDVRPYYWAADIAVQPSVREGQGQVLSEAMAAGLPVVCTDAGGMKEVVLDGQTGMVVKAGDPQAFAGALARLAGDPHLRQQLGQAGLGRAREELDISVNARRHIELYEKLLASLG